MAEFFGFGGYQRTPEGYMSWQHLMFVSSLMVLMIGLAVVFGLRNRKKSEKVKNRVLIASAIFIDLWEIVYITLISIRNDNPLQFLYDLPLFLCSIQLITIPLAAFTRGRVKDAALDFVFIFGLLGAVLGTYGAGQNYGCYPVLSLDNVASGISHCVSGFTALYIAISGMASMKKRNIPVTYAIICAVCGLAYLADRLIPYNYMFLIRGDGTPYDIVYNWVNGHPVFYPLLVVALFLVYIAVYYGVYYLVTGRRRRSGKADEKQ